jgi:hypothetical protein
VFDGATTTGDYIQISSTVSGDCHDAGASYPGIGQVLGRVLSTNAAAGTFAMLVAGAEVRWSDAGWGPGNNRNLVGRFTTQTFTVPRLSEVQDCYLQQYDNSVPPKYSRYTAALHVDYPL